MIEMVDHVVGTVNVIGYIYRVEVLFCAEVANQSVNQRKSLSCGRFVDEITLLVAEKQKYAVSFNVLNYFRQMKFKIFFDVRIIDIIKVLAEFGKRFAGV